MPHTLGRHVSTTDAGGTVYHAYDGIHCVADLDGDGSLLRAYTWGAGVDNLLAVTFYSTTATNTLYAVTDPLGTVLALVASDGTIAVSYTYDSWGNVLSVSGDQAVAAANRFTWQGREYSYATGLYNFRARWYDPAAGRWLSKDPIGLEGGLNLYEAFGNNPVCFGDSIGCSTVHIHTSGSVITLVDPTMNDFRMAISQQDDNSIMELEILGHGSHNMINIEPGENGAGLIWEPSVTGDSVWMSDKGDKFSDLIRDKLAQNAMIDLNGCNTGRICKWVKNIWYIKRFYVEKKHSTTIERGIM